MPSSDGDKLAYDIRHSLQRVTIGLITVVFCLCGFAVIVALDSKSQREAIQDETDRTSSALCTLRDDLKTRVHEIKKLANANTDGLDGIPADVFDQWITNRENTINTLKTLDCTDN